MPDIDEPHGRPLKDVVQKKAFLTAAEEWRRVAGYHKTKMEDALMRWKAMIALVPIYELDELIEEAEIPLPDNMPPLDEFLKKVRFGKKRSPSLRELSYQVLQKAKKPLHAKEILQRLEKLGVPVKGKAPMSTLVTSISRDERIARDPEKKNTWIAVE